ncbi:MAG: hypothetical protein ACODAU_06355 [Myxococcota bacterium]
MANLPPCGIYRTTAAIGEVPAGRLVLFHNHGEPGPGVYLPVSWRGNRARFAERGTTLPDAALAATLEPLPAEGLYRVTEAFTCCAKRCRTFEPDTLVQLGYDAGATPILFQPEWVEGAIAIPERGTRIDRGDTAKLARLQVPESSPPDADAALH